jgi:hypothetical protein
MGRVMNLDDLQSHLETAKEKLACERTELLALCPLTDACNREEYAFAYVRAERLGMQAISRRLADVSWLPMQLDPKSEIVSEKRTSLKRWITSSLATLPNGEEFGNDFIHALTRCGMAHGWDTPVFFKSAVRIANLFRDLSCLIGLVYYGSWLSENQIESIRISDTSNLCRMAEEVTGIIQSPEMHRLLRAREQDDKRPGKSQKPALPPAVTRSIARPAEKRPPVLTVITNDVYGFTPDPATI